MLLQKHRSSLLVGFCLLILVKLVHCQNNQSQHEWVLFGDSSSGQMGNPSYGGNYGVPFARGSTYETLAIGPTYVVGIDQNQVLWAWGRAEAGILADTAFESNVPIEVPFIYPNHRWRSASTTPKMIMAIDAAGDVWYRGYMNVSGAAEQWTNLSSAIPAKVTSVKCGLAHCLFRTLTNRIFAVGDNQAGQLGAIPSPTFSSIPVLVLTGVDRDSNYCAGRLHSVAYNSTDMFAWGICNRSQTSEVPTIPGESSISPVISVKPPPWTQWYVDQDDIVQVNCGSDHTLVRYSSGNLVAWGANQHGQVGRVFLNQSVPVPKLIWPFGGYDMPVVVARDTNTAKTPAGVFSWGAFGGIPGNNPGNDTANQNETQSEFPKPPWLRMGQLTAFASSPLYPMLGVRFSENTNCGLDRPTGPAVCLDGVWGLQRSGQMGPGSSLGTNMTLRSKMNVFGDFVVEFGSTVQINLPSLNLTTPLLNVTGCAAINGSITVNMATSDLQTIKDTLKSSKGTYSIPLLQSGCRLFNSKRVVFDIVAEPEAATTPDVAAEPVTPVTSGDSVISGLVITSPASIDSDCESLSSTTGESTDTDDRTTLSAIFTVDTNGCSTSSSSSSNTWKIILGATLGGVALIVAVIAIVIFNVPAAKRALMPYKGANT